MGTNEYDSACFHEANRAKQFKYFWLGITQKPIRLFAARRGGESEPDDEGVGK
jgi:hypothetical protein